MNRQELIDKAVHSLEGVYEKSTCGGSDVENYLWSISDDLYQRLTGSLGFSGDFVCTKDEFQQRANELGYINGYRWGVEYPTNGEKPDLPDDVVVCIEKNPMQDSVDGWDWLLIESFKITDQRYKPADTSYLSVSEIPESKCESENVSDWYDYEAQKAVAPPPVDLICESFNHQRDEWVKVKTLKAETKSKELACVTLESEGHWGWLFWGCKFRPLDHNRKAEAEKKRVVDAVVSAWSDIPDMTDFKECFSKLYDLGYLRMPEDKQ